MIEDTVGKALNGQSRKGSAAELKEISIVNNYFVSTKFFPKSIEILKKKHFLIIILNLPLKDGYFSQIEAEKPQFQTYHYQTTLLHY